MAKTEKDEKPKEPVAVVYKAVGPVEAPKVETKYKSPNAPQVEDFSETFPVYGAAVGIEDLTKIAEVYRNNKGIFDAIWAFFKNIKKKKVVTPATPTGDPVVVNVPVLVVPQPPVPVPGRVVKSLKVKWYFFEVPKESAHPEEGDIPNKNMRIATKAEFDAFVSGKNAIPRRSRLHVDITPVDQNGREFEPGDEANKLLLRADGYPAFEHILGGPVQLTNEYDDFGCTPVLKIPKNANLPERAAITYQVRLGDIVSDVLGPVFTD